MAPSVLGWEQGSYLLRSVTLRWPVQTAASRLPSSRESGLHVHQRGALSCVHLCWHIHRRRVWSCSPVMLTRSATSETQSQVNTKGCEGNLEISGRTSTAAQPSLQLVFRPSAWPSACPAASLRPPVQCSGCSECQEGLWCQVGLRAYLFCAFVLLLP